MRSWDRSWVSKIEKFFLWLIVTVVKVNLSYLLHDYQLISLSTNPFNNANTANTVGNGQILRSDVFNEHIVF